MSAPQQTPHGKSKKGRDVIFVRDMSRPVLHFY